MNPGDFVPVFKIRRADGRQNVENLLQHLVPPRHHHRGQRHNRHGQKCMAPGTNCGNPQFVLVDGERVLLSPFCEFHACRKIVGGQLCSNAKSPKCGNSYCPDHMRCAATDRGMRCGQNVKNNDPSQYSYCEEFHLCCANNCKKQRLYQEGQDLRYCQDHRCQVDKCRLLKGQGNFCNTHTCEHESCFSLVPGEGNPGDPSRFCDRHRRCKVAHCTRFCHIRENGMMTPYCSAHYCLVEGCENQRVGAHHCIEHQHLDPGWHRDRYGGYRSAKCVKHDCDRRRVGRHFCVAHKCSWHGCESEAGSDGYCQRHRHHGLGGGGVGGSGGGGGGICPDSDLDLFGYNLCAVPRCREHRLQHYPYCAFHKCAAISCAQKRAGDGQIALSPFCEIHACKWQGCPSQVLEGSLYCAEHGCRVKGCMAPGRMTTRDGVLCNNHLRRRDRYGHDRHGRRRHRSHHDSSHTPSPSGRESHNGSDERTLFMQNRFAHEWY